jgi:hypothetical protein
MKPILLERCQQALSKKDHDNDMSGHLAPSSIGRLAREELTPATLKMDNKSAISLCKNPMYHE